MVPAVADLGFGRVRARGHKVWEVHRGGGGGGGML